MGNRASVFILVQGVESGKGSWLEDALSAALRRIGITDIQTQTKVYVDGWKGPRRADVTAYYGFRRWVHFIFECKNYEDGHFVAGGAVDQLCCYRSYASLTMSEHGSFERMGHNQAILVAQKGSNISKVVREKAERANVSILTFDDISTQSGVDAFAHKLKGWLGKNDVWLTYSTPEGREDAL